MKEENRTVKQLVDTIVEGIQEKKGTNIAILDLTELDNTICQYFVICDGESNTHVDAVAGSVEEYVREHAGDRPNHTEGFANAEWILLDYFDVIVHVFQRKNRTYYNLEGLWADARRTDIENLF